MGHEAEVVVGAVDHAAAEFGGELVGEGVGVFHADAEVVQAAGRAIKAAGKKLLEDGTLLVPHVAYRILGGIGNETEGS